ncbi:predicted protein [Streptomyces iranensis]|uniref:Uncharacterized protein n=1 Tax=Streptomyces iranensis TaxID=576784 RepID=A0A060ZBP2_9ACTN|nr:predicted protein [Streptomyces iranensis]
MLGYGTGRAPSGVSDVEQLMEVVIEEHTVRVGPTADPQEPVEPGVRGANLVGGRVPLAPAGAWGPSVRILVDRFEACMRQRAGHLT